MDINFKKPYEISIWEDTLTFVLGTKIAGSDPAQYIKREVESLEGINFEETQEIVLAQYYKEKKLAIIGSNTMSSPIRAYSPSLKRNINGSYELTFIMNHKYYDEDYEKYIINPFTTLLTNERKIKLRRGSGTDAKWYDLIIKNIQESSESKTFTYTAKAQFINELSKTGFNLEFDSELENNTGTITELAEKILEGTDWKLADNIKPIQQYIEEPVYKIISNVSFKAFEMDPDNGQEIERDIPQGAIIYAFYSSIIEENKNFQFLYNSNGYTKDENNVIDNASNYYLTSPQKNPEYGIGPSFSYDYRGNRLIKKQITEYDATIDKYVKVYQDNGQTIYGFEESEYISPAIVTNLVANPAEFVETTGWLAGKAPGTSESFQIIIDTDPDVYDFLDPEQKLYSFLQFRFNSKDDVVCNLGINNNRSTIKEFTAGENYVFAIRTNLKSQLSAKVASYELKDGSFIIDQVYFDFDMTKAERIVSSTYDGSRKYELYGAKAECQASISYSDLIKTKMGIFIYSNVGETDKHYLVEEVQFYPYRLDALGNECIIGGDVASAVKQKYYYYYPNPLATSIEDISFIYKGEIAADYAEVYNKSYEKIRTITASESNRFNLIQALCETFECWAEFDIKHKENGEIELDDNYRQIKTVNFKGFIGKENQAGFKYRTNLKSIQRTIDSEEIVTKLVVKNNSNEFAPNGFCSIARANESPSGENFILNFDYYIKHRLLDYNAINADLYLDLDKDEERGAQKYIGYLKKLRDFNNERDALIEEQAKILPTISKYESQYQTYKISVDSAEEQLIDKKTDIKILCGYSWAELVNDNLTYDDIKKARARDDVRARANAIVRLQTVINSHRILRDEAENNLTIENERLTAIKNRLDEIREKKVELNTEFYTKYSRFIQEGSWIDEDYIDDELYYLDACGVSNSSAWPKISYTINVIEISQIEGFENYNFDLGDKTYIEDTEFFGWLDDHVTPYREEVIISETTEKFDQPENNQIKVQNYKTQFEDLFQRITATTNSVQYSSGKYNKVSNIIEESGDIKLSALENSMINNSFVISNAKDESTIIDETGLTSTNLSDPSKVLRLISGGLFLSTDGGLSWKTGITGSGINANYINTGRLDASIVNIMNGQYPSFRWDAHGINAYQFSNEETGNVFNFNNFIRFDQFGIYGVKGFDSNEFKPVESENPEAYIKERADFALTWNGFSIKSNHNILNPEDAKGHISITSDNDFQVFDGEERERIKIGWLGAGNYGLRISDKNEEAILETKADGGLWLKKRLNISSTGEYSIGLGYLDKTDTISVPIPDSEEREEITVRRTFDVNNNFIVWEDGSIKANNGIFKGHVEAESGTFNGTVYATDGRFTGEIYATGGKIGNMTINQVVASKLTYKIESSDGSILNNPSSQKTITLTAKILNNGIEQDPFGQKKYFWYIKEDNDEDFILSDTNEKTISMRAGDFINRIQIYFEVEEEKENEE